MPVASPSLLPAPPIVPGGVLAFVPVAPGLHEAAEHLEPAERDLASTVSPVRRDAFVAGRIALRAALGAVEPGLSSSPLLRTARGAPLLPQGVAGSVSHKRTRAVALAAPHRDAWVGVDLEARPGPATPHASDPGRSLARRILTVAEQDSIARLDELMHRDATLLYFALKEAVYKAIDPFVERYVRFTEVEIRIDPAAHRDAHRGDGDVGAGEVSLLLPECERLALSAQAAWQRDAEWIVAVASVRRG